MALSSNWLKLQESNKVSVSKKKKVVKKQKHDWNKDKKQKRGSKIMDMVDNMTKEIKLQEQNKKDGKTFQFKSITTDDGPVILPEEHQELNKLPTGRKATEIGKYLAMDCEFVGVGAEGKESALARISITNYFGHVVMDEYVKPKEKVTDWRTWVSGIKPSHMKNAISFSEAQKRCADLLKNRVLVGHALKHDLEALLLSHPKSMIRDTSRHPPYRKKYAMGKAPSLKKLSKEVLNVVVQEGEHSSVEDARATMLLYKFDKKEFERLHQSTFGSF